jgi:glutathione S-transferase
MKIYWIKAQAPRRVLALVKHLGIEAELIHIDAKAGGLGFQRRLREPGAGPRAAT